MFKPEYLVIGHVTNDLYSEGQMIGGSVVYSALTGYHLGYSVGMITSFGTDFSSNGILAGIHISNSKSNYTTTFCNTYKKGERSQIIKQVADPITVQQIPSSWRDAPIVHLCPVAKEVGEEIFSQFPNSLVCLTPQGLMRNWREDGRVFAQKWLPSKDLLSKIDIIIFSEEDIKPFPEVVDYYRSAVKIVILTCGKNGAILFFKNKEYYFPAVPVEEKDPTGAGDVFAASFTIKYFETKNCLAATRFANYIASFAVTEKGTQGIPKIGLGHRLRKGNEQVYIEKD
ncbi:MAG: PfkB family carbohydrate kinase [Candidatus Caldatribacteriota bacterium]